MGLWSLRGGLQVPLTLPCHLCLELRKYKDTPRQAVDPRHPRYFPLVKTTELFAGNRSCKVDGPLSSKRGSGAGDCHNTIWSGTSASTVPKTFFFDPLVDDVFIPCKGNSLSRIWISPMSTPPVPGTPAPVLYCSFRVSDSSSHR